MKISTKGRYGLAVMQVLAQKNTSQTVQGIAEQIGVSKIYLEQVFAMLKKSNLVISQKGSAGGYSLADTPKNITVYSILKATETSLFEITQPTTTNKDNNILENILINKVWSPLDNSIKELLSKITLEHLIASSTPDMFYI